MHFPDWFLALSETARAPYNKYSFQLFVEFMSKIEDVKNATRDNGDNTKLKDATTKFLALARHLLSFYPGTHAKEVAAAKKGKAALQDSDSDALDESSGYSPPSSTDDD